MARHNLVAGRPVGAIPHSPVTRTTPGGGGSQGPPGPPGPAGRDGAGAEGAIVTDFGAEADGVTDDSAGILAAAASGAASVHFPPGIYKIGTATDIAQAGLNVTFAAGAVLLIAAAAPVTFSGARQRIDGLSYRLASASASTFTAVTVSGANAVCDNATAYVDADVDNATLLKLAGDGCRARNFHIVGTGHAFLRGLDYRHTDGSSVDGVTVEGMTAEIGDSGVTKTFGALVSMHGVDSRLKDLTYFAGGRDAYPNGVINVSASRNTIENPQIIGASLATYGIRKEDAAEFTTIIGGKIQGRNNGTFPGTGTEGIYCGHLSGHLKVIGTLITGWDWPVGFHGGHDTPQFYGAVLANNGEGGILIDSEISGTPWPVSGLLLSGVYHEEVIQDNDQFIWCKTGSLIGGNMVGSLIGYENRVIKVETGFATCHFTFGGGNRLSGDPSAAVAEPHATSEIYYKRGNATDGSNTIAAGAHTDRVFLESDPVLDGIQVGSAGTHVQKYVSTTVTFNLALTDVTPENWLEFNLPGASVGDGFAMTLPASFVDITGVFFNGGISAADTVRIKARKFVSGTVTPNGQVRICAWKH